MSTAQITRREFLKYAGGAAAAAAIPWYLSAPALAGPDDKKPNIVLCMTDDQGWGDVSYNGHPVLKTPELDKMAASGVRFDRFYAAAPVCSPTRGSVLTGRHPNRFKCFSHGYPLPAEEFTIAQAVKLAGYTTGHFGKWHLNGVRGPGKPVLADDPRSPGRRGFDEWLSATNFFDLNPSFGRNGKPEKFTGDGSDIIVDEALKFIDRSRKAGKPFLAVIWYGSPHNPHSALPQDRKPYAGVPNKLAPYYGELAAVDRSMGKLRAELRRMGIADNTIVWFCSDNGGAVGEQSVGGLRGGKSALWEGGIRVPGLLEWPARIKKPFRTSVPCNTSDMFPTVVDLLGVTPPDRARPLDGISLVSLLDGKMSSRPKPMAFWSGKNKGGGGHAALIDNQFKLHLNPSSKEGKGRTGGGRKRKMPPVLLYDLAADPKETTDLSVKDPERVKRMTAVLEGWKKSVRNSIAGNDYK
jgi:arylsulfatase A-like enzyme